MIIFMLQWKNLDSLLFTYFLNLYINVIKVYAGKEEDLLDFDGFTVL
jgi:hypothetical protein